VKEGVERVRRCAVRDLGDGVEGVGFDMFEEVLF
jgi:hypothetical protein